MNNKKKADHLVNNPRIKNIEHTNSAKTANVKENCSPKPRKLKNFISSPDKSICSFGYPCASIAKPITTLAINKTLLFKIGCVPTDVKYFMNLEFDDQK